MASSKTLFLERLRLLREQRGWSQYQMADELAMPRSTYAGYESGRRQPDLDFVERVAFTLNTTISYLCGETSDPRSLSDVAAAPPTRDDAYQALQAAENLTDSEMQELRTFIELGLRWMRRNQ